MTAYKFESHEQFKDAFFSMFSATQKEYMGSGNGFGCGPNWLAGTSRCGIRVTISLVCNGKGCCKLGAHGCMASMYAASAFVDKNNKIITNIPLKEMGRKIQDQQKRKKFSKDFRRWILVANFPHKCKDNPMNAEMEKSGLINMDAYDGDEGVD